MAATGVLNAEKRIASGTGEARRLRQTGRVPGVFQALDGGATPVQVSAHELFLMLSRHASENLVLDLQMDGEIRKAQLKDVQRHPVTGKVLHMDFFEVSMTETMQAHVGIVLVGDPVGVTQGGGVLEQLVREIEVECLPGDMVEEIEVDVSGLNIGDMLDVANMQAPSGMTILTPPDIAIALVSAPRTEEAETAAEGDAAESEPGVVGAKKETGEKEGDTDKKSGKG
jgi:large subunit ribosomal protein L25